MNSALFAVTAAALLAVSNAALIAQHSDWTHVTIHVNDPSGASIPKAQVKIMSSTGGGLLAFTADSRGIVDLYLKPGEYQYRIASTGFCPKNDTMAIENSQREVRANLLLDGCPSPCAADCITPIGVDPPQDHPVMVKVTDLFGAAIPDALVEVNAGSASARTMKSDADGLARIGLPAGTHSIRVSAGGFRIWRGFVEVQGTEEVISAKLSANKQLGGGVSKKPVHQH